MEAVAVNSQGVFSLRGTCPHSQCRRESVFIQKTTPAYKEQDGFFPGGMPRYRLAAVMVCQGCQELILGMAHWQHDTMNYFYAEHYPIGEPDQIAIPEIPDNVKSDFNEALRCRSVNAYNATVEMCRRALQTSCVEQGADPNLNLVSQIDWVHTQGKITVLLKDIAHKIRLGGNRGAHSGDPNEPTLTPEDADAVILFSREYFRHIYEVPQMLSKFDFSRAGAKAAASVPVKKP